VVESIEHVDAVPPAFPKRTGVSDTFSYIAHFLPVAERSIDDHPDPINPMPNGAMPPEPRRRGRGGLGPRGHRFES
jgi:hypothetical protein